MYDKFGGDFMFKKIFTISLLTILLTGCGSNSFKSDYESLNGKKNESGKINRTITINSDNPYKEISALELINMINSKKTFYVYFGFPTCPWCRSVIEKSIEVSKEKGIKTIYYVNVLNIRDELKEENGKAVVSKKGSKEYYKLLKLLAPVLDDYKLENVKTNEKRIYAPNFVYVKDGKPIKLITGISSKQKDPREKLSKEILDDEEKQFDEFFK